MKTKLKCLLIAIWILLLILATTSVSASSSFSPIESPAFTASDVIAEINGYRQANGINALQYNSTLAGLAQAHSEHMAATGNIGHDEGGTTPSDRAYAAGYGDGKRIILSEIVFGGYNAELSDAMNFWKISEVHHDVILNPQYVEIGAGVATIGSNTYFTAEIGLVTGSPAPSSDSNGGDIGGNDFVYSPVMVATPMEDGSIVHIVQVGQTLWTIAAVYGVDLQDLLDLNNMNSGTWVFPGDEILIQPAGANQPTKEGEEPQNVRGTPPRTAIGEAISSDSLPTAYSPLTQEAASTTRETPTQLPVAASQSEPIIENPTARWMILIAFVVIFGVVVGSTVFQKLTKLPPQDDS